jgi:Leucine-rich repeat (LRR) protein
MPRLKFLFLFNNQLRELPEEIFNDLTSLKYLNLKKNRIKKLPKNVFVNLKSIDRIDIFDNPTTTNELDFSGLPNVKLFNETNDKFFRKDEEVDN